MAAAKGALVLLFFCLAHVLFVADANPGERRRRNRPRSGKIKSRVVTQTDFTPFRITPVFRPVAAIKPSGKNYNTLGADWPGLCQVGKSQSPIDVLSKDLVPFERPTEMIKIKSLGVVSKIKIFVTDVLPHVEFTWKKYVSQPQISVAATKTDGDIFAPLTKDFKPNQLKYVGLESSQCHFHTPSESALDGVLFDGVLHCVHFVKKGESKICDKDKNEGGLGCPVVLSFFLQAPWLGYPFDRLLTSKPGSREDRAAKDEESFVPLIKALGKQFAVDIPGELDLDTLRPTSGEYAAWKGSLTTVPCTEGVLWVKLLKPLLVSPEQISHLRATVGLAAGEDCSGIVDGKCFPARETFNNRDRQKLNGRVLRSGIAY